MARDADGRVVNATVPEVLTRVEIEGRRQALEYARFLIDRVPGYEHASLAALSSQIGIRETRRIVGHYQLTEQDVLGCADFDDTIGVNGWPVEAHVVGDVEFRFAPEDSRGFNQLPYRMLLPQLVDNLFVVGRCASMTQGGQSSGRVTGPCFAMGQAAGTAADLALAGDGTAANVDVPTLQRRLEADGAYLGRTAPTGMEIAVS